MAIKIFDTLSGKKKALTLPKSGPLKLFVCGPTVYDDVHLGHARAYLAFDLLVRYLRSLKIKVFYLQNITDVDDKIIERAKEKKTSAAKISAKFSEVYFKTCKMLGISSVDKYVKASASIKEIKSQISRLMEKGYAYETGSGVYFNVKKFKDYGKLSRQNLEELRSGYRVEPDPEKHDVFDFALWKKKKFSYEPSWPSPWGAGRPGWHIEDTAIAEKYFGLNYHLHGGGMDLKFPHHEAEIAQAEALSGKKPFVIFWLHIGFLLVNGEKMSKSLHNFITVPDFLKRWHPDVLRWLVFSRHYSSPFDYKEETVSQSVNSLFSLKLLFASLKTKSREGEISSKFKKAAAAFDKKVKTAMEDDFNTPEVISEIFQFANFLKSLDNLNKKEALFAFSLFSGLLSVFGFSFFLENPLPKKIKEMAEEREVFRTVRNFSEADALRGKLEKLGYKIDDTPSGSVIVFNNLEING
ncbi:MAG: cysteine--tRNA ligase [Candidatus Paceibacterota bacterium]